MATQQLNENIEKLGFFGIIKKEILILLLNIAGVDYEKLKTSPKSERVVYPSLGILMCLASLWTGFGLTMKMQSGMNLNWTFTVFAFIFTTSFALLLEMIIVGTLKSNSKIWGNLGIRILLGINLMLLQVVPVLIIVFQPSIEVYKNEQVIQKTVQARESVSKSQNIDGLTKMQSDAQERFLKARENKINPPENKNITAISEELINKVSTLEENIKKYETSKYAVAILKSNIAILSKDKDKQKEVFKAIRNLRNSEAKMNEAKLIIDTLQPEIESLKIKKEKMIVEYDDLLNKEFNDSSISLKDKDVSMKTAMTEIEKTTKTTQDLAQNASTARFFSDVSAFLELMMKNNSIFYTSIFVTFVALLIDLMPVLTKMQLSKGVYAKLINDDEEIIKAINDIRKTKILCDLDKQRVEYEKQKVSFEQERLNLQQIQSEITISKIKNESNLKSVIKENRKKSSGILSFFSK